MSGLRRAICLFLLLLVAVVTPPALSQVTGGTSDQSSTSSDPVLSVSIEPTGDRIHSAQWMDHSLPGESVRSSLRLAADYRIWVGDTLTVVVRGKVNLNYGGQRGADSSGTQHPSDTYQVQPDGCVQLPLIGSVTAAGKTAAELKQAIAEKLSEFYRHFTVDVAVSSPGLIRVWVTGQIANPGSMMLSSSSTALEALLKAGILSTGTTRLIQLNRDQTVQIVDMYSTVITGRAEGNPILQDGDRIFVPAATRWVSVEGEACRLGQFELVSADNRSTETCTVADILKLCQGVLPTASLANATVRRPDPATNEVRSIRVDLLRDLSTVLLPGDELMIPKVTDYQPTIRLIGEFRGIGVYQRVSGAVLNKTGVYKIAKDETVGDVITRTGGTTPQADLSQARIERLKDGKTEVIPLELDRLLMKQEKSVDVVLESGDTIVVPALQGNVYVFGQVANPGALPYEPNRSMVDYLGAAGGPNPRAKSSVVLVRSSGDKSDALHYDLKKAMKGVNSENPFLEPGDVVFVPERVIADWRDISQIISTVRLLTIR